MNKKAKSKENSAGKKMSWHKPKVKTRDVLEQTKGGIVMGSGEDAIYFS